jgi:hypothetical protein
MRLSIALATVIALLTGSGVWAKDVCIQLGTTGQGTFVFRAVKKLKPGSAVPIAGFFFNPGSEPVAGTAIMRANGQVLVGFTLHADNAGFVQTMTATTDGAFNGSLVITGGFGAGAVLSFAPIDCKTVTIP